MSTESGNSKNTNRSVFSIIFYKFFIVISFLVPIVKQTQFPISQVSKSKDEISGLFFLDYFFVPNSNIKLYTGLTDDKEKKMLSIGDESNSCVPSFTKISNVVKSLQGSTSFDEYYYLCAKDSNLLFQMPSNLNFVRSAQNYATDSNKFITGTRCTSSEDESLIIIAYIGQDSIYTFQFQTNTFTQYLTFTDEVILEYASPDDRKSNLSFYLMTKNVSKKKIYLKIMTYPDEPIYPNFEYLEEQFPLYTNIRISKSSLNNQLLIFTFNESVFKFYFIDSKSGVILKTNSDNSFMTKQVKILDFEFIDFSELFLYRITTDDGDHYGTGDLNSGISIFDNIGTIYGIFSYTKSPEGDSQIAISTTQKTLQVITCAFSDDNGICVKNCSGTGNGYNYVNGKNYCTNCLNISKVLYSRYCMDTCPVGMKPDSNGICNSCASPTPYYDPKTTSCVDSCPLYSSPDKDKVCINCFSVGLFYYALKKSCVLSCPTNWIYDSSNGNCINCQNIEKYYCNKSSSCCDSCPETTLSNDANVCYTCKSINKYYSYSSKSCIDTCPKNGVKDDANMTCDVCKFRQSQQFYLPSSNSCVDSCPGTMLADENNICYECKSVNKFYSYSSKTCIDACPNNGVTDRVNMTCDICELKKPSKYYVASTNSCVDTCPQYHVVISGNICKSCKDTGEYFYNDKCYSSCPNGCEIDTVNYLCIYCKNSNKFLWNSKCVEKCPETYFFDQDNKCYSCKDLKKYYLTNTAACIENCENWMSIDSTNNNCTSCKDLGKFLSNNVCVDNCPINNVVLNNNVCYSCKDKQQYYLTNTKNCISKCGSHMRIDEVNKECTDCFQQSQYLSKNECKNECPEYNVILENNVCSSCKENNNQYYLEPDKQCVSKCAGGVKIDEVNKVCTNCLKKGQFYYNNDCLEKCPQYFLSDSNNICYNCYKDMGGKYLIDNSCVSTCPENSTIDKINHVCDYCPSDQVYLPDTNKCVDKCPDFYLASDSKRCYKCSDTNEFFYNGKCLKSCPSHCAVDSNNFRCDCCVDSGKYFFNNKCEAVCPEYSEILPNNLCLKCSLEPIKNFYLDSNKSSKNTCVSSCPDGSTIDSIKKYCKHCLTFNLWLFQNNCISECKFCQDEEKKICKYCNDCHSEGKIYNPEKNICVDKCDPGSVINNKNECQKCINTDKKFYLNTQCWAECPKNHTYNSQFICIPCNSYIFKNICIPNCPFTYGILDQSDKSCVMCLSYSKYRYNSECRDKCPENTITDTVNLLCQEQNISAKCKDTCNDRGKCNESNNFCTCDHGFTGPFCEISIPIGKIEVFAIKNLQEFISKSESNLFGVKFYNKNLENLDSKHLSFKWKLNENNDESAYMNGSTEKILKLKPFCLLDGKNVIRLNITNLLRKETYKSLLVLEINSIDVSKIGINVLYFSKNATNVMSYAVAMKDYVSIHIFDRSTNASLPEDYQYKFYYEGRVGEQLPISDSFLSSPFFSYNIPFTKKIIVHVKDNRGQIVKVSKEIKMIENTETSDDLSQLMNGNNSPTIKFLILDNYLNTIDKKLSIENVTLISNFLKDNFDKILTNSSSVSHNSILSVINLLVENQITYKTTNITETKNVLSEINDIIQNFSNKINSLPNNKVTREDLNSYYRTVDTIFSGMNSLPGEVTSPTEIPQQMDKIKDSINSLNQYLARDMMSNERVVISTKNFDSYIEKPGRNQEIISLQEIDKTNKTFRNSSDFTLENKEKSSVCDTNTLLCVDKSNFETLKNSLPTKKINFDDLTVFTTNFNNSNLYNGTSEKYSPLSTTSISVGLYDSLKNSSVKEASYFGYQVDLQIKSSDKNSTNNSACITFNTLKKPTINCQTFFNYTSNKTLCKCKGTGEVVNFYNNTLSNMAKLFQFPEWNVNLLNPLSLCLVYGTGMIVITFSIILLLYDYYDDRNFLKSNVLDDHQNIQNDFKDVISLCRVGILTFALYISMYVYPFFAVFSMYNYNQPRFIRFSVEMLSILMSISFSLLPYYKTPFEYKQIFEDTRDVETAGWNYQNLPSKISDILNTIVYSVFATIVMSVVIFIFSFLMKWGQLMSNVWQHRQKIVKEYISQYMIRPLRLPEKWKMLRNRILALNNICGKWIIKKHNEREEERFKREIFKNKDVIKNHLEIRLLKNTKAPAKSNPFIRNKNKKEVVLEMKEYNKLAEESFSETKQSFTPVSSMVFPKEASNALYIAKENNFHLNIDNVDEETRKSIKKMDNIRLKYFKKQNANQSSLQNFSGIKKFHDLRMIKLKPYFVFNIKPNKILLSKFREEYCRIFKSIIAVLFLFMFYCFFYFLLIIMISDIYQRYQYYILKVWLCPSLLQLIIVKFIINYSMNVGKSYILFKHYSLTKSKGLLTFIVRLFIGKDVVSIYKIRNLVTKYETELKAVSK